MKKLTLIMCLDVNNGIRFNNRRQSRDRVVIEDILKELTSDIWMLEETKELFTDFIDTIQDNESSVYKNIVDNIRIDNDWHKKIGQKDIFFGEDILSDDIIEIFEKIIVYRWDKVYPYDKSIDLGRYDLAESKELVGYSHKLIKKELYFLKEK